MGKCTVVRLLNQSGPWFEVENFLTRYVSLNSNSLVVKIVQQNLDLSR